MPAKSGDGALQSVGPVAFVSGDFSPEARELVQNLLDSGGNVGVTDPGNGSENSTHCCRAGRANPSDTGELSAAIIRTAEAFGGIDWLIHCDIRPARYQMILDIDEQEWDRVVSDCLRGFFLACKCAIPYMLGRDARILLLLPTTRGGGIHEAIRALAGERMVALMREELSPYALPVDCLFIDQKEELRDWMRP